MIRFEIQRDIHGNIINFSQLLASCSEQRIEKALARIETTEGYKQLVQCFPSMKKAVENRFVDANIIVNSILLEIIVDALIDH